MRRTNRTGAPETLPVSCGACGRQGHRNDPNNPCPLPPAPWAKVGVEIEGFWDGYDRYQAALSLAEEITGSSGDSDGSLRSDNESCDCGEDDCDSHDGHSENHGWHAWELRTKPGSLTEAQSQVSRLYPDGTNDSAGMHVHVSFRCQTDMGLIKSEAFFEYWHERWTAWGKRMKIHESSNFWSRLAGDNRYCYSPKRYATQFGIYATERHRVFDERYMQLNFHNAYSAHRTVECRLLPMFRDLKLALSGIAELLDIYDSWITGGLWATGLKDGTLTLDELTDGDAPTIVRDFEDTWEVPGTGLRAVSADEPLALYATDPAPGHRLVPVPVFNAAGYSDYYNGLARDSLDAFQRRGLVQDAAAVPPPF